MRWLRGKREIIKRQCGVIHVCVRVYRWETKARSSVSEREREIVLVRERERVLVREREC